MAVASSYSDSQSTRRIDDAEATRISNRIDEELRAEKELLRRRKNQKKDVKAPAGGRIINILAPFLDLFDRSSPSPVAGSFGVNMCLKHGVMLLGQAESGKSTLQKQFQLYYASNQMEKERPAWRPVVYFNIIKAVRMILEELDFEFSQPAQSRPPLGSSSPQSSYQAPSPQTPDESYSPGGAAAEINGHRNGGGASPVSGLASGGVWQEDLAQLRTKLLPLVAVENSLASDLNGGVTVSGGRAGVFVRAGWQGAGSSSIWPGSSSSRGPPVNDLVARMLAATRDEVDMLWNHSSVRTLLKYRKLRLEESASFFLDNIHRIAEPDYLPSTDDILNVRLQTLGVKEHSFDISLSGTSVNWLLYDVGGARGQRHAWVPYFDDATAIIFLAPISAFDQYLEEDPRTNRIDDSLQLFTTICSNKLLKNTHLVLMLNKTDLLRQKLSAGIRVKKYITSYGNRPNTYEEVSEYFRAHFLQVHRRNDISKRALYAHFTSMLDIKATQKIIVNVGEAIIRSYITDAGLT
ncbi:G-alpha-domain-containing protein [Schizopora paradoxa]|uniref:G-alpha-domain-containing protein n=1 Tax=Schizopora paradoxa TaxID=27342 RepID=A0A0H2S439_9AGAM|nr:G-alpha-domain-containing protein [Schizopora paradoxa]